MRDSQQRLEIKESEIQSLTIRQEELMNRLSDSEKLSSNQKSEVSLYAPHTSLYYRVVLYSFIVFLTSAVVKPVEEHNRCVRQGEGQSAVTAG